MIHRIAAACERLAGVSLALAVAALLVATHYAAPVAPDHWRLDP